MIIALVGMAGSGKSEVTQFFKDKKIPTLRFGDITEEEVKRRNIPLTPANEKLVREELRKEGGMDVYAKKIRPKADKLLENSKVIVLDGLYSWEEYLYLKKAYGTQLLVLAVLASPKTRYIRLGKRSIRPLTPEEAKHRDHAEIENINKGGPIAMADYMIINEGTRDELLASLEHFYGNMKR